MRPFSLIGIALKAESLRLSHKLRRTAFRAASGCFALILLFGALGFLHVAAWYWLREVLEPRFVALIVAGGDLLLGVILILLATRSAPGLVEREALAVRRRAMDDMAASLTMSALAIQLLDRLILRRRR